MNGLSIRWRLTFWYVGALSVILLAFGALMYLMIRSYLISRVDSRLTEATGIVISEMEYLSAETEIRDRLERRFKDFNDVAFKICDRDGNVIAANHWLGAHQMPELSYGRGILISEVVDIDLPFVGRHRLFTRRVIGPNGQLVVYALSNMSRTQRELTTFLTMLFICTVMGLLLALTGGIVIARRAMEPILRITSTAERISSQNLSERVQVSNPADELGRLAGTLNATFDRLQCSIDEMRQFTADAAHELRTPLAVIRTAAEVSLRGLPTEDQLRRAVEVSIDQTTRLTNLVGQLLTLSRHDAGLEKVKHEEVSLTAIILDVVDAMLLRANDKQISLMVGDLPDANITGDDIGLSQLFYNLIDNAIKYSPPGGTVKISGAMESSQISIAVDDEGPGIDPELHSKIFLRFFRVDASRSTEGTGLGLAICKSIATAHGGDIRVVSQPGNGARFIVHLPGAITNSTESGLVEHRELEHETATL